MRKLLSKAKLKMLVLGLVTIAVITIAGNISLFVNHKAFNEAARSLFKHKISIGPVFYVFPNLVIANDLTVTDPSGTQRVNGFELSRVSAQFSLWKLMTAGAFEITDVAVSPSLVSYHAFSRFVESNIDKILEIIRSSTVKHFKLRILDTLMDFDRSGQPDYMATQMQWEIRGDLIYGHGLFRADQFRFNRKTGEYERTAEGWPLFYTFKGMLDPRGVTIDHFVVKSGNLYSKLWGGLHAGSAVINGFLFMDTTREPSEAFGKSLAHYFRRFSVNNELENIDTYVLDITGRMEFHYPTVTVNSLNFTYNGIPVRMNGNISLEGAPTLSARLDLRHPPPIGGREAFFDTALAHITSRWEDGRLTTDGNITLHYIEHEELNFTPDNIEITVAGLTTGYDAQRDLVTSLRAGDITYRTPDSDHRLMFRDLKAVTRTSRPGAKTFTLEGPFYGGTMSGQGTLDMTRTPAGIAAHLDLADVETRAMEDFIVHFAKFNGRMDSAIDLVNTPELNIQGDLTIRDGTMTDLEFFNWIADSFKLPALTAIDFKRATSQFQMNNMMAQLHDIRLKTEDVHITGYFGVDNNNLVKSELTVGLSQTLLSDSPKFRPVLKMFEEDEPVLDFDFQMSGSMESVNFQWMPSPVKKKIQKRIPDFIERIIEENIDDMMEPASNN